MNTVISFTTTAGRHFQGAGQTVDEINNYGLSRVISRDNSNKSSFPALTALVYEPGL